MDEIRHIEIRISFKCSMTSESRIFKILASSDLAIT